MDFDGLIDRCRGPLIGLFVSWGVSLHDAEELSQDAFVVLLSSGAKAALDPLPFLRGVARNLWRNWRRSGQRRERHLASLAGSEAPSADPRLEEAPHRQAIVRAIEALPRKLRAVVWMHYLEEASVRDVAALLGVSAKAVESRLYQARKRLREILSGTLAAEHVPEVRR